MGLAFAIPLIFGGLSPNSAIYQRSIAIGQMAARISAEQQAAQEAACMNGTPLDRMALVKPQGKIRDLMAAYWKKVEGAMPADLRPLFHTGVKAKWDTASEVRLVQPGVEVRSDQAVLSAFSDPFVASGLKWDAARVNIIVSGDGKAAVGQWRVLSPSGLPGGVYEASFTRQKKSWKFTRLSLTGQSLAYRPLRQFCHAPGDVLPHRLRTRLQARVDAEARRAKAMDNVEEKQNALNAASGEMKAVAQRDLELADKALENALKALDDATFSHDQALAQAQREAEEDANAARFGGRSGI